jgi:uncharacterized protein YjbJ (UPF0337 family)
MSTAMNWDRIQGDRKQFKGQAKQRWGKLTHDNLDILDGRREQLVGRIQEAYGGRGAQHQCNAYRPTHLLSAIAGCVRGDMCQETSRFVT